LKKNSQAKGIKQEHNHIMPFDIPNDAKAHSNYSTSLNKLESIPERTARLCSFLNRRLGKLCAPSLVSINVQAVLQCADTLNLLDGE
jgi:hypothetical protein